MSEADELDFSSENVPEPPERDDEAPVVAGFDHVEYAAPDHTKWRVERGSDLIGVFELEGPEFLAQWHEVLSAQKEAWDVVRRLFGVAPLMGVEDPDEIRAWPLKELASHMGVQPQVIEGYVASAKMFWKRWRLEHKPETQARTEKPGKESISDDEVDRLLREQGFVDVESKEERLYIASRIRDLEPWLESENLRGPARSLISQEVGLFFVIDPSIRELRQKIKTIRANTSSIPEKESTQLINLIKARREEQGALESTLKTLGMTEASGGGLKKKMDFVNCVSGMFDAMKAYYSQEDRGLIDGFAQAAEIELLMTATEGEFVRPMQYRPDLVVVAIEARKHLWEAEWSPTPLSRRVCRKLTMAFGLALEAAKSETGEVPKPDDEEEEVVPSDQGVMAAPFEPSSRAVATAPMVASPARSRQPDEGASIVAW